MTISHSTGNLVGLTCYAAGMAGAAAISGLSWLVAQLPAPVAGGAAQAAADHAANGISVTVALAVIGLLTQVVSGIFADRKAKRDADSRFAAQSLEMRELQVAQKFGEADRERINGELDRTKTELDRSKEDAKAVAADLARARERKHEDMERINGLISTIQLGYMELVRANDSNAPALKAIVDKLQLNLPVVESIGLSADDIMVKPRPPGGTAAR